LNKVRDVIKGVVEIVQKRRLLLLEQAQKMQTTTLRRIHLAYPYKI
jgi:hypothetical protein